MEKCWKCWYCGREVEKTDDFCSDECAKEFHDFDYEDDEYEEMPDADDDCCH